MPEHTAPAEPSVVKVEPASITELARLIVAVLVTIGVFNFDDATANTITLVVGGLISIVLTWWTRRTVTPTAKPRSDEGTPLMPATPPATPSAADPNGPIPS